MGEAKIPKDESDILVHHLGQQVENLVEPKSRRELLAIASIARCSKYMTCNRIYFLAILVISAHCGVKHKTFTNRMVHKVLDIARRPL